MFNYQNLESNQFEKLCRDIMQVKTGKQLHTFPSGPDGGVDLTDDSHSHNIVVQVKHYERSSFSTLKRNLEKEVEKVRRLAPRQYYICVSQQLTDENVNTIYEMFSDYMESTNNIVTLDDIDSFLHDPQNIEITRKHTNLWLESGISLRLFFEHTAEVESPEKSLVRKLKDRLEYERTNHPSFKLMNEAYGFDNELIPKGTIPLAGRKAILNEEENIPEEEKKIKTLTEFISESHEKDKRKHITIEGEGGIGKTVALLSLALEPGIFPDDIPAIYIPLHRLNRKDYEPSQGYGRLGWYIETYLKIICGCTEEERASFSALCNHDRNGKVQIILLLDGYNEVHQSLKDDVKSEINDWAAKRGVQIITTSRTSWSCGDDFMKIRLQPLTEDTIRKYLEKASAKVPAPGDNLWKVIDYPLMLTLYTHISAVQGQAGKGLSPTPHIFWRPMNRSGDIIWNYLQKEWVRCETNKGNSGNSKPEDYAVAILHTAPYIAWRMSRAGIFSLTQAEDDDAEEESMSFAGLVKESLMTLKDPEEWSEQIRQIIRGSDKTGRARKKWKSLAGDPDSNDFLDKAEWITDCLLSEINLFRLRDEKTGSSTFENADMPKVEMMHQQFRDGLAAIWLCQRIETMEEPFVSKNGVFKSTGDNYAMPLCWREKIGRYVLKFAAEIMDEDNAERFWEAGRVYQPSDVKFAYTMLNLMSERSLKDGIHQNDFSGLDFSGMNLRDISLFLYRAEESIKLKLPCISAHNLMVKTGVSARTFLAAGHRGSVNSVAISRDGKRVISGGNDGAIRIWDLERMICEKEFVPNNDFIKSIALDSDGKRAVSGGNDGVLRVWDLEEMRCEKALNGHRGIINSVSVSSDGKRAASGGNDRCLRIWNLENMTCEKELKGYSGFISSVSFTGDSKRVVSVENDRIVRIWDLESMSCLKELEMHSGFISSVSFTGDGKRVVSVEDERIVRIWDLESMSCLKELKGQSEWAKSVAISSDGKRAMIGEKDGCVQIWNLEDMRCEKKLGGHRGRIKSVAISRNGKLAVSGGEDGSVRIWDLESLICVKELEGCSEWVRSVAISNDGKQAVNGGSDGLIQIWDLKKMVCKKKLVGHKGPVLSIALNINGNMAISGGVDGIVRVWNLEKNTCLNELKGHKGLVRTVSVSSDGKRAVSGGLDGIVRIWNLERMVCEEKLEGHRGWIRSISISEDGKQAMSSGDDRIVRIWDLEKKRCKNELEGHKGTVRSVSMSGDMKVAVSGGDDGIRNWDLQRMVCGKRMKGYISDVDDMLPIWSGGKLIQFETSEEYIGTIRSIVVSNKGLRAVSGGSDSSVRIWDLKTMRCEKELKGHGDWVSSVAISCNGKKVVSGSFDGTLRIWNLERMTCEKILMPLPGIDIGGIDLTKAIIDSEEDREILRQNGALV